MGIGTAYHAIIDYSNYIKDLKYITIIPGKGLHSFEKNHPTKIAVELAAAKLKATIEYSKTNSGECKLIF